MVGSSVLDRLRRRTEDIVRYYGELNRRVAGTGADNIPQLLTLAQQLEGAIAEIGEQELRWVSDEIKRVLDDLVQVDAQLQRLRELKASLEPPVEIEAASGKRPALLGG
jgi:hypothetical protein